MIAATRPIVSVNEPVLYVAFELGKRDWKLAMTSGFGVAPMLRTVASGDWAAMERALQAGRARFGLAARNIEDAKARSLRPWRVESQLRL